jgi:hypothetical protein
MPENHGLSGYGGTLPFRVRRRAAPAETVMREGVASRFTPNGYEALQRSYSTTHIANGQARKGGLILSTN